MCSKLTIKTLRRQQERRQWREINSKLTIKTLERRQCRRSRVFLGNFEQISHLLVFLLLTLIK